MIWDAALNIDNQCVDSGHHLLRTMIQLGLNGSDLDKVYKLYLDRRLKYSQASLKTLLTLILSGDKKMDAECRLSILRWLLPHEDQVGKETEWFSSLHYDTLSKCLVALMVRPKSMEVFAELKENDLEPEPFCNFEFKLLESMHLRLPIKLEKSEIIAQKKTTLCHILKEEIKDALIQMSGAIMDKLKKNVHALEMIQMALDYCHLLDLIFVKMESISSAVETETRFENVIINLACQALNSVEQVLFEQSSMEKLRTMLKNWNLFQTQRIQKECNIIFLRYLKLMVQDKDKVLFATDIVQDDFGEDKEAKELALSAAKTLAKSLGEGVKSINDHEQIVDFTDTLKSCLEKNPDADQSLPIIMSGLQGLFSMGSLGLEQATLYKVLQLLQKMVKIMFANYHPDDFEQLMTWVALCIENIDVQSSAADSQPVAVMKKSALTFLQGFLTVQSTKNDYQLFSPKVQISLVFYLAKLVEKDLHGEWANLSLRFYQMASHEEDHDVVEAEKIPAYLFLSKFTRNPCQSVRDEAIGKRQFRLSSIQRLEIMRLCLKCNHLS